MVATQVQDANGTYYVHADNLQAPRILTNSAAQIVWRAKYQAYGRATVANDVDGNGITITYNQRLPGQYADAESGLYYNYFRNYDPSAGRYVQSDPIGLRGGINTYLYANANPTRWIDPLGLDECQIQSEEAIEAERLRQEAEQDKINALFKGDQAAYDNAVKRIDEQIWKYLNALCCGGGKDGRAGGDQDDSGDDGVGNSNAADGGTGGGKNDNAPTPRRPATPRIPPAPPINLPMPQIDF